MPFIISIIISIAVAFPAYAEFIKWNPQEHETPFQQIVSAVKECKIWIPCYFQPRLGALTTISTTTRISNFPAIYNSNLGQTAATNSANTWDSLQQFNGKASSTQFSATTAYFGGTATSSFSSAGALTLITPLTTGNGGTGSTTLSANQVLLGNGTGNVGVVSGLGASGQFLTSGGAGTAPTWTTSSFDQTLDYNFTGTTRIKSLNASSTAANPIVLNGVSFHTPTEDGASSTALMTDGSGGLTWNSVSGTDLNDWQEITATTSDVANGVLDIDLSTASSSELMVYFSFTGKDSGVSERLRINNDIGPNYGVTRFKNYTLLSNCVGGTEASTTIICLTNTENLHGGSYEIHLTNQRSQIKKITYSGMNTISEAGSPFQMSGVATFNKSTTTITSLQFCSGNCNQAAKFNAGAVIRILGSKN